MSFILNILKKFKLKNIIVFESNPDFSDNTYWLFKYMAESTDYLKKYKCVWFLGDITKKKKKLCGVPIICISNFAKVSLFNKLRRFYYHFFAKIIIDCNRCIHKRRSDQYRVYLTHGMPIKIPETYLRVVGSCDLLPVSGEGFIDFFGRYVDRDSVRMAGSPRNDILVKSKNEKYAEKYIVWMPTFRQHKSAVSNMIENRFPLGLPAIKNKDEIEKLNLVLEENNIRLMLRPHPAQDLSVLKIKQGGNIIIAHDDFLASKEVDLYTFISKSSALITDYSSIYLDYLFLDKPIGLTLEDAKDFSTQWPLFFNDMENELSGINILSIDDLCSFVKDISQNIDDEKGKRREFMNTWGMNEINSCEVILNLLRVEANL